MIYLGEGLLGLQPHPLPTVVARCVYKMADKGNIGTCSPPPSKTMHPTLCTHLNVYTKIGSGMAQYENRSDSKERVES